MKLDPFPTPTFDASPILRIIAQLEFRQARAKDRFGRPQIPHAYVVRGRPPGNEPLFEALFHAIQQHGRDQRYNRRKKKYLYPGDGFKYWTMSTHLPSTTIINRMLVEDDIERLRAESHID
jgi:hypothetical protein